MTIGRKIGGAFGVVILLTLILGVWAIYSMRSGADVSEIIAQDRLPRFTNWTSMQNDLLEASYYALVYFARGEDSDIEKTYNYIKTFSQGLDRVEEINSKMFYEQTDAAVKKARQDMDVYANMMKRDQATYILSEKQVKDMMAAALESQKHFEQLIQAMSGTLEYFIGQGDLDSASVYARNIALANAIFAKVADVYQDLLVAERNSDLKAYGEIQSRLPEILQEAKAVDDRLLREECHKIFAQAAGKYQDFATLASAVADTLRGYLQDGKERYSLFQSIYKDTIVMVDRISGNSNKFSQSAADSLSRSTFVVSILLVIVTLLGLGVAISITRAITRPLKATQHFAQEVASGDLDKSLDVHAKDETGMLADALRSMVSSLRQNIHEAKEKSEQAELATEQAQAATAKAEEAARRAESAKSEGMLAAARQLEGMAEIISSASTQLSAQIKQSDEGASESSQRLQEAATAMNEMNASVQEVARNAASASGASNDTRQKAEAGQQVVAEVVSSMAAIHKSSIALKEDMAQLNERAQDINRIMGVISDIADQTNLLALNAAIEAARAGEAGRGFAVVADEVRKLAEKTMASTQDVSSAIHAIQDSTSKSMSAVDYTVDSIDKATQLANQSGAALEEIVATVVATSDQVGMIAAASEEQSAASEQINHSITEVNDMSRQTADAMQEATIAVSNLAKQAQKLTGLIEDMKTA